MSIVWIEGIRHVLQAGLRQRIQAQAFQRLTYALIGIENHVVNRVNRLIHPYHPSRSDSPL